jgi:hypothetical protein
MKYVIVFFFSAMIIFAQGKENKPAGELPDISKETGKKTNEEKSEKLFFQGILNNNLIFYNLKSKIYYINFRKDKWDYDNDDRVRELIEGNEYVVFFQYIGEVENQDKNIINTESIRKNNTITTGAYLRHNFVTDSIRGL